MEIEINHRAVRLAQQFEHWFSTAVSWIRFPVSVGEMAIVARSKCDFFTGLWNVTAFPPPIETTHFHRMWSLKTKRKKRGKEALIEKHRIFHCVSLFIVFLLFFFYFLLSPTLIVHSLLMHVAKSCYHNKVTRNWHVFISKKLMSNICQSVNVCWCHRQRPDDTARRVNLQVGSVLRHTDDNLWVVSSEMREKYSLLVIL